VDLRNGGGGDVEVVNGGDVSMSVGDGAAGDIEHHLEIKEN
jgi:hypothetical protein